MIIAILLIILAVYYTAVVYEVISTKYYNSPIKTKIDFLFALIPFQMWIKEFYFAVKNLE